jgi:hypothetical protein
MTCFGAVKYFLLWTLFLSAISLTSSSSGDRSEPFRKCLKRCLVLCKHENSYPGKLPLYLIVFGWRCSDECKYTCMHKVTQHAVARGWNMVQFYGKVRHKDIKYKLIKHQKMFWRFPV